MAKYMTGYCWECCKTTKQKVIDCDDSIAYRVFGAVFTLGFSEMLPHDYNCECTKCGHINSIRR